MKFKFLTLKGVISEKDATSCVMPGSEGQFGVLHGHEPMVVSLTKGTIYLKADEKTEEYKVTSGVAMIERDSCIIIGE